VESQPEIELIRRPETEQRNWLPLAIAAGVVILIAAAVILSLELRHKPALATPISAALDPYSANLPISGLALSDSTNLAGGKVTYLDGRIANTGNRTVSAITVQVLFYDSAKAVTKNGATQNEVTQNETQPLRLIRTRDPYIDVEPVSAAPLHPGDSREFRLIFDTVSRDWNGAFPEIRILHVTAN
jgi:Protein of unknown function (DUF2393)